jgi:RimJ/RimL family protein N-acetyltransferase
LEHIGMRCESIRQQSEWIKGRWWDTLTYGMFRHEWQAAETATRREARLPAKGDPE